MGIEPAIDITVEQHKRVLSLLEKHLPSTTVWVYGSRAKWTARPQSDLDMVVFTTPEQNSQVFNLREAFEESNLPFRVDLFVWDDMPERFRKHIKQDYVVLSDKANDDSVGRNWLYHPQFPRHWKRKPLYAMAQWVNGLAFREIQFSAVGKPVIKIAEIKGGISGQTKFTQQTFDESVRIRSGDLLFSWSGQPETSIDAFWWRGPEGWLNQHVFRVTPINGVDSTFFFYLLRYLKPNFVAIARNKQTTGLGHVTKRDLENIEAALPDLSEQRAIAHILGTLDDKIELNRRMNETLETMARALFKSWFVDFEPVRDKMAGQNPDFGPICDKIAQKDPGLPKSLADLFPDRLVDSELGEIPEGWEVVPLPELIAVNPSRSLRKGEVAPYLDMANMPTRGHVPDTVIDRPFGSGMRFTNGDTLVARITPCLENGKTAYVDFLHHDRIGWGSTEYIVMRPMPPLPNEFAYCLARSAGFREFAIQNMTGTSGRQRVPANALSQFLLPSPPEPIAARFSKVVRPLFTRASEAVRETRTLAALRDTLLPKLVSGEMRVGDTPRCLEEAANVN